VAAPAAAVVVGLVAAVVAAPAGVVVAAQVVAVVGAPAAAGKTKQPFSSAPLEFSSRDHGAPGFARRLSR
jgi:hypothetical protein